MTLFDFAMLLVRIVLVFAMLLGAVVFIIWLERRVVARMQARIGPNRVGPQGLLQSVVDGLKLFFKEDLRPTTADVVLFGLAPLLMVIPAIAAFAVIPFGSHFGAQPAVIANVNVGLLYLLGMGGLQVYGIVLAGWASGSNYPLLGAIRSTAQMISYEIAQGLSLVGVLMYAGTLSLSGIVAYQEAHPLLGFIPRWNIIPQFPLFVVFVIAGIAEVNRAPFDLPEAETELVGGYHTEYSGMKFAMFFLAEYVNMVTMSALATTLFLGGPSGPVFGFLPWLWPILWFVIKIFVFIFMFIWLRATFPRLRFDQLMAFGWKVLIPVALAWIAVTAVALVATRPVFLALLAVVLVLAVAVVFLTGRGRGSEEPSDAPEQEPEVVAREAMAPESAQAGVGSPAPIARPARVPAKEDLRW